MRDAQLVVLDVSEKTGMIRATFDPWVFAEVPLTTGCWSVRQFTPSVEDEAYRTVGWSKILESLDRAQLLLGLKYYVPEIGGICFQGLSFDEIDGARETVEISLDPELINDEVVLCQLRDGFRQGLQAVDVEFNFVV